MTSPGTFLNFGKLLKLKDVAGKNVVIDKNTTVLGLKDVLVSVPRVQSAELRGLHSPELRARRPPTRGSASSLPTSTRSRSYSTRWRTTPLKDADNVPDIDPSTIRVGVYNGTAARTSRSTAEKEAQGGDPERRARTVNVVDIANADRLDYSGTVISTSPSRRRWPSSSPPRSRARR